MPRLLRISVFLDIIDSASLTWPVRSKMFPQQNSLSRTPRLRDNLFANLSIAYKIRLRKLIYPNPLMSK